MNATTPRSVEEDLAFMRALVSHGDGVQRPFGEAYFAGGVCYVVQILLAAGQVSGLIPSNAAWGIPIGIGPTAVFLIILTWVLVRARNAPPTGLVGRAVVHVFRAAGLANLALILVIGAVAWRERNLTTWLIYPCCVFVLQGIAWAVAYGLRQRPWQGLVAGGWVVTALVMAWFVQSPVWYTLAAGFGLFAFMAVPGALIIRQSRRAA
jgi:hypothetical protein